MPITILKGTIVSAPALGELNITEHGYLVAEDGIITIVVAMDRVSGDVVSGPDIITRGFVYVRESEDLIMDSQEAAMWAIENCLENDIRDWSTIKQRVRDEVSHVVYDKTKRSPMILPIIMEV